MITYDNNLSAADYANLRKMIGWSEITETQAQRGIDHTTFLITAKEDGKQLRWQEYYLIMVIQP